MEAAVLPGTPRFVIEQYKTLAERARERVFGIIEEDVVILDTETTGLSVRDNELIEISAAVLTQQGIKERFDTFVHPTGRFQMRSSSSPVFGMRMSSMPPRLARRWRHLLSS